MNEIFAGVAAFTAAVVIWGLGRSPRKQILKSKDASLVAGINRSQITLLRAKNQKEQTKYGGFNDGPQFDWENPKTIQDRKNLVLELRKLMSSGPEERLIAIKISSAWDHSSSLPFLRQGLKDFDSRVVEAAASGIESHKRKPSSQFKSTQVKRPPRNVALMR